MLILLERSMEANTFAYCSLCAFEFLLYPTGIGGGGGRGAGNNRPYGGLSSSFLHLQLKAVTNNRGFFTANNLMGGGREAGSQIPKPLHLHL